MKPEFTWQVNAGASLSKEPKVKTAAFGDGYQQRVGSGINANPRSWQIECIRKRSEIDPIEAFLDARAGAESFRWKPPIGNSGLWICKSWNVAATSVNVATLSATFEEVFGD